MARAAFLFLILAMFTAPALAEDELAKLIIGRWDIKQFMNGKPSNAPASVIELRNDSTYTWTFAGQKREGKFELKGADLHLHVGQDGALVWHGLSHKDGKIHRSVGTFLQWEWTRLEKQ